MNVGSWKEPEHPTQNLKGVDVEDHLNPCENSYTTNERKVYSLTASYTYRRFTHCKAPEKIDALKAWTHICDDKYGDEYYLCVINWKMYLYGCQICLGVKLERLGKG